MVKQTQKDKQLEGIEKCPTGIRGLDEITFGGLPRGRPTLVTGTAGTGKTSVAAAFVAAACRRGERCLYIAFEEVPAQIIRNMASVGYHLDRWADKGLLRFHAVRPTFCGLEQHLVSIHNLVNSFHPSVVIVDPITNLMVVGEPEEVKSTLTRMIDFLKNEGVTALFTNLTRRGGPVEQTEAGVSSLMDTWLLLRNVEMSAERNRLMFILKSPGMAHSNQVREFVLTNQGIQLTDVCVGPRAVLAGSARVAQEARDRAQATAEQAAAQRRRELEQEQAVARAQLDAPALRNAALAEEIKTLKSEEQARLMAAAHERAELGRIRSAEPAKSRTKKGNKTHASQNK